MIDPGQLAELDEQSLAAALLDLLDTSPEQAAETVRILPAGAVPVSPFGIIVEAIRDAVASGSPTRADVLQRILESTPTDEVDEIRCAFYDATSDQVNTGRRAADVARRAACRLANHHLHREARTAAERFATGTAGVAELREAMAALEAGSAATRPLPTALDAIDRWARHETTRTVATGYPWFDCATDGGLPVGGFVVLGAPPQIGKSALALQLTAGALLADTSLRAVWGAGEMTLEGIGGRLVTVGSGIVEGAAQVTHKQARGVTPQAREAGRRVAAAIGDRLAFAVEKPLTVDAIDAAVARTGARLVVVDYIQLLETPDGGRDRVADLDRTVGRLRDLAVRRECAMIVVSSIAKPTTASAHAGQLCRGTAEIGYAAELVYAAQREETADGRPVIGPDGMVAVTWRCAKSRNVEPRDLVTRFDGDAQTFHPSEDLADFDQPPGQRPRLGAVPLNEWNQPKGAK